MRRKYGITEREYWRMVDSQGGVCAVCGCEPPDTKHSGGKKLHVDHDHESGRVRGLLCISCNRGLGLLKDSASVLGAASAYLLKWKSIHEVISSDSVRVELTMFDSIKEV